jgi:hypothetical protein
MKIKLVDALIGKGVFAGIPADGTPVEVSDVEGGVWIAAKIAEQVVEAKTKAVEPAVDSKETI